ncbi:MAG: TPM domain-containing protein [Cellulosilyticum sp.]|nr:TPM domain-containing protein [Cellulosilyticum sp.]
MLLGFILLFSLSIQAAITYPRPSAYKYLNDYAGVVDSTSAQQIISLGNELEQKTGAQAVVVTINTLEGYPIEDYANGLFRSWGIGNAQKDNGLLVLLVVQDQQWRVEVGRGLEGAIPDVLSNRVMEGLGRDDFVQGNYGQGLAQTYSQFCDDIAIEYNVILEHSLNTLLPADTTQNRRRGMNPITYIAIIGLLLCDVVFNRGRLLSFFFWSSFFGGGRNNRRGGGGYGGYGGGSSNGGGSSGGW